MFEVFWRLAFLRMSAAVLVHANGRLRSFQPSMKARNLAFHSGTDRKEPRRMAWRSFDDAEPDLDRVQLRPGDWGEVHVDARVRRKPVPDLDAFVGDVVVYNQV